jgi:hypothetical protein
VTSSRRDALDGRPAANVVSECERMLRLAAIATVAGQQYVQQWASLHESAFQARRHRGLVVAGDPAAAAATGGPEIATVLCTEWVVYANSLWTEVFRSKLAAAHECAIECLRFDFFDDLQNLERDIIQGGSIVHDAASNRILCRFTVGETLSLAGEDILFMLDRFPRQEMTDSPKSIEPGSDTLD